MVKISRMLENMIIDDNNIIINNDSNSFTDGLDNKNLENVNKKEMKTLIK